MQVNRRIAESRLLVQKAHSTVTLFRNSKDISDSFG